MNAPAIIYPEGRHYDDRLFGGGLRARLHNARFRWLQRQTRGLSGSVLELGCFNARSLDWLSFTPARYTGVDAGWEGGVYEAVTRYPQHRFIVSDRPEAIEGKHDVAIALETMEHLPRATASDLAEYRDRIDRLADAAPLLFVTVPVEVGPVFAAKWLAKRLRGSYQPYSLAEFIAATFGASSYVEQNDHKGFDWRWLVRELSRRYRIESIEGLPFPSPWFSFSVGIRASRSDS